MVKNIFFLILRFQNNLNDTIMQLLTIGATEIIIIVIIIVTVVLLLIKKPSLPKFDSKQMKHSSRQEEATVDWREVKEIKTEYNEGGFGRKFGQAAGKSAGCTVGCFLGIAIIIIALILLILVINS